MTRGSEHNTKLIHRLSVLQDVFSGLIDSWLYKQLGEGELAHLSTVMTASLSVPCLLRLSPAPDSQDMETYQRRHLEELGAVARLKFTFYKAIDGV
jgi:hypothetical protein